MPTTTKKARGSRTERSSVAIRETVEPEPLFGVVEIDLNVVSDHHNAFHRAEHTFGRQNPTKEMAVLHQRDAAVWNIDVDPAGDAREQLLLRGIINRREGTVGVRVAVERARQPCDAPPIRLSNVVRM
jgi:hypothetical protein